jgi:hypothetical protein
MSAPPHQPMPFGHKTLPTDDKSACGLARQLIQLFASEANRVIPIGYIDTFLMVACDEGNPVNDYAAKTGVIKSVKSRHLLDIGDRPRGVRSQRASASGSYSIYGPPRRAEGDMRLLPNFSRP